MLMNTPSQSYEFMVPIKSEFCYFLWIVSFLIGIKDTHWNLLLSLDFFVLAINDTDWNVLNYFDFNYYFF